MHTCQMKDGIIKKKSKQRCLKLLFPKIDNGLTAISLKVRPTPSFFSVAKNLTNASKSIAPSAIFSSFNLAFAFSSDIDSPVIFSLAEQRVSTSMQSCPSESIIHTTSSPFVSGCDTVYV